MVKEAERFIYHEARLMDEGKYEEWAELFADDCVYWIPSWESEGQTVTNPKSDLSIIYWNKQNIKEYVERLLSGEAHVMIPSPRSTRYITNVMVDETSQGQFLVKSNWFLHDYRLEFERGVQQFFGGFMEHQLKQTEGSFKIVSKKVVVLNDDIKRGHLMII